MRLIGITGRMGHGKDTVAQFIQESWGHEVLAFADTLKQVVAMIACEPLENFYDRELKEKFSPALGMTRREALQKMGTEVGRNLFGPNIWTDNLITRWLSSGKLPTVVSDVRFDEEARAIIANGGVIIRVVRPALNDTPVTHSSEEGIDPGLVSFEIVNDSSISALHDKVCDVIAELMAQGG